MVFQRIRLRRAVLRAIEHDPRAVSERVSVNLDRLIAEEHALQQFAVRKGSPVNSLHKARHFHTVESTVFKCALLDPGKTGRQNKVRIKDKSQAGDAATHPAFCANDFI